MIHYVIIPCGGAKQKEACAAINLYIGAYFKINLRWAQSVAPAHQIKILSAKHGLLHLYKWLGPYDLKMGQPGSVDPLAVRRQGQEMGLVGTRIYALGGGAYLNVLRRAGFKITAPTEGLPMGKQMERLKKNMGRLPVWNPS